MSSARPLWLGLLGLVVLLPLLVFAAAAELFGSRQAGGCVGGGAAGGVPGAGMFAAPLALRPGRSYEVGATEYGGPGDPSSGDYGAIPDPAQAFLPAHPDSFAELSLLTANPANKGGFSFTDADALGTLPYLTALRVQTGAGQLVLEKRDVGYGQGPGARIANGEPYRLDLWWQAAQTLGVSKGPVRIALAPAGGAAATLEALPVTTLPQSEPGACASTSPEAPLPLVPGYSARILPSGLAAAPQSAPEPVRRMLAAGNRLHDAAYSYGGAHGSSLDQLEPSYDCSSAVSYVLHGGGVLGSSALDSTALEDYGLPGPGRWVSVYANAAHAFMYVAGLRLDTVEDPAYDEGPNRGLPGPKWRVSPTVPDWSSWVVRHPRGL